ncbi:MAG: alcohol dehydrogenase catalytic domain-containing protein [Rhizomicrobium sp.]
MKAAILKEFGKPLAIEEIADPVLGTGEVIVDVVATSVLPYMAEVLSGQRKYMMTLPMAPGAGAVGRIRAVGPDSTRLKIGEWVLCDPTVRSRDDARTPDITLQGLSARGEGGLKLQEYYHHGAWAQQMLMPTENVFSLGEIEPADAVKWCMLARYLVPYGGLLAIDFKPGGNASGQRFDRQFRRRVRGRGAGHGRRLRGRAGGAMKRRWNRWNAVSARACAR